VPNGSPARARRIAQIVMFFRTPLVMIKSAEYATLHAAPHKTIYAAIDLSE
jgi:hypothetical protein